MYKILVGSIFLLILAIISACGEKEEPDPLIKSFNQQAQNDQIKGISLKKTGCNRAPIKDDTIAARQASNTTCHYNVYYKDDQIKALKVTVTKVKVKYNKTTDKTEIGNAYLISRDRRREFSEDYIDVIYKDITVVLFGLINPDVPIEDRRVVASRGVYWVLSKDIASYTDSLPKILMTSTPRVDGNFYNISILPDDPDGYSPLYNILF